VEAARRILLSRHGRLELAAVVAEAGTTTGAVYHHFGSRGGLLRAVVEGFYRRLDDEILQLAMPGGSWAARERERIRRLVDLAYGEPLAPVLFGLVLREPAIALLDAERTTRLVDMGTEHLRRGQAAGEVRRDVDPAIAAALVMGGLRQAIGRALAQDPRPPAATLTEDLARVVQALADPGARR